MKVTKQGFMQNISLLFHHANKVRKWGSYNKDLYKVLHFYLIVPLCKARKWRSHNKDLYKVLHLYYTIPLCKGKKMKGHKIRICPKYYTFITSCLYARLENEGHKIRICTKYYTFIPSCLYARLKKGHKIRIYTKYYRANLSLGGTIRTVTPQIFETHPTSKQHRIQIKKSFYLKLFIKRLHKSCRIWNSN
jgi:hypothetical protein